MMTTIQFGPDKSQILRGIAIIFMIILHNNTLGEFKICVPIFTFLVGYGYAFAKKKNLRHGLKRCWHLLSHFWLILLGIFLPVAILAGGYRPTMGNVLENMFGLDSNLNWYSWYIYFYIFAMLVMIPVSRIIDHWPVGGTVGSIVVSFAMCAGIHILPGWSTNLWLQALQDCLLCGPPMYVGYFMASGCWVSKLKVSSNSLTAIGFLCLAIFIFFLRGLPYVSFFDFITVPLFVVSVVAFFNIVTSPKVHAFFIALGKESMNMWFLHALFATTCTAMVFAPLIAWIHPKLLYITVMVVVSYSGAKIVSKIYNCIAGR